MEEVPPPHQKGEKDKAEQRAQEEESVASTYAGKSLEEAWPWKGRKGSTGGVMLERGPDGGGGDLKGAGVGRTKSLTDEDLEELKGCLDLGFGFSYQEIPGLCTTLPALELCYSMNRRLLLGGQEQQLIRYPGVGGEHGLGVPSPVAN